MTFPPIKPDRCLLWITLHPDDNVATRYAALKAALKPCRLHPLDTTASAELVIVEAEALNTHMAAVRDALGPADMIHRITGSGGRLQVSVIAPAGVTVEAMPVRPPEQRPPWLA